ncbi:MAG: acetyl-CoA carboxylase biotin carboxyl carrier protein subunit [Oligoflexus sp.]
MKVIGYLVTTYFVSTENVIIISPSHKKPTCLAICPNIRLLQSPRRYRGRHSIVGKGLVAIEGRWQSFTYCQTQRDGAFIQWINLEGQAFLREERPDDLLAASKGGSQGQNLVAPVPGKVVKVLIEAGSKVRERQTVVILESMKMEFEVQASRSGIIQDVLVQAGQQVQADELLAHWRGED